MPHPEPESPECKCANAAKGWHSRARTGASAGLGPRGGGHPPVMDTLQMLVTTALGLLALFVLMVLIGTRLERRHER